MTDNVSSTNKPPSTRAPDEASGAASAPSVNDSDLQTHAEAPRPAPRGDARFMFLDSSRAEGELGWLGHYRILKVLGQGGMGVVFLAEDSRLGRKVAVKSLLPSVCESQHGKDRFLREARATAALEHDHIVPIFEVNEANGVPYLSMPLLKGTSLNDHCKVLAQKPNPHAPALVPLADALRIGRQIAEGLAHAHAAGLIHRDIKPANIWLESLVRSPSSLTKGNQSAAGAAPESAAPESRSLSTGFRVKILDFGLARAAEDPMHLTQSGAIVGTPAYMSPEQARGDEFDARSDLFSLGALLYELVTGQRPFQGKDTFAILTKLATETPLAPAVVNPAIPADVSQVIMRLLEKDAARRPASAEDVVHMLAQLERQLPDPTQLVSRISPPVAARVTTAGQKENDPAKTLPPATKPPDSGKPDYEGRLSASGNVKPGSGKSRSRRWLLIAAGVLVLAIGSVLVPQIVIYIRNKDGSVTEIKVPKDATLDIKKDGKTIAKVGPEESGTKKIELKPPQVKQEPIDFAAERKAAEWLFELRRKHGKDKIGFNFLDANGVGLASDKLPDVPFVVTHISGSSTGLGDADLAHLSGCRRLERLGLSSNPGITDAGIQHLRGITSLRHIDLPYTSVGDGAMAVLAGLPRLESLSINATKVSDRGLAALRPDSALRVLYIQNDGNEISDAGLQSVAQNCPELRELRIVSDAATLKNLRSLEKLPQLRTLAISGAYLKDDAHRGTLAALPSLEHISLYPPLDAQALARLKPLAPKLRAFTYFSNVADSDPDVTGPGWKALLDLQQLEQITIFGQRPSFDGPALLSLAQLPRLRTLELRLRPENRKYTTADVQALHRKRPDLQIHDATLDGKLDETYEPRAPLPGKDKGNP